MAVESAEAGRLQPVRPRLVQVLVFVTVGGLLGGVLAMVLAESRQQTMRANAVISVAPSSQIFQDVSSQEDDSTALVQSEIIILSGPQLRQEVERRVGDGAPVTYTAAQVGSSTIVNIDAEATTAARAVASAAAVVDAYSANRQARLRSEIERAARVVDAELARIERTLASQTLGAAALQQEYGRLLAVRSGLFRASANVDQAVTVVRPPVLAASGLPPLVRDVGVGVLLGALLGALALMAANQLRRRVRSREDLSNAGVPVLHPDLGFYGGAMADFAGPTPKAAALRLLAAQLVRPAGGGGLVLLGATPGVGTSFVAATMAVCLSERSDVLLVLAADVVEQRDGSAAQELGVDEAQRGLTTLPHRPLTAEDVLTSSVDSAVNGVRVLPKGSGHSDAAVLRRLWQHGLLEACLATGLTVVVDAPALSESTTTVDLASRAGGAVLVVGRAVTTRREVDMVRQMFLRQEIPLLGAIINQPATGGSQPPATPPGSVAADAVDPDAVDTDAAAPAAPVAPAAAPVPVPARSPSGTDAGAGAGRGISAFDRLRSRVTP